MGNTQQKYLYKQYFNELYLNKKPQEEWPKRPKTGIDTSHPSSSAGGSSSRHTPELAKPSGRATADLPAPSRYSGGGYQRKEQTKTVRVVIDSNYTIAISVPERVLMTMGGSGELVEQAPNCGWLLAQLEIRYAQLVKDLKQSKSTRFRKKLIVALKTVDKNESIDFWLTQYQRLLKPLPNNLTLEPHYTKILKNKAKLVQSNDFELLKVIGKGGFSKVYMVRKKDTGFIYAMKVMKKEAVASEAKIKQIMNERLIMEQLEDHPFVVKLHYAFQSKENLHFIIDFCTGGEMFYHLQQKERFPEFLSKFYFAEILLGIEYLHSKNVVYRDLKPENVLIDTDGHLKLADFGLSKIFKIGESSFSFCGSPEYMCPEILKREGHNHMVDFYTLGAILYEMLTGLPPYYTNKKSDMPRRIIESELTFPATLNPVVVNLMRGLLEKNPSKRLGSKNGILEIREHEWCQDIDWEMFMQKKMVPPWKPRLDQSNFDPEYTQLPLNFDENNFKRTLQGNREFSVYYESPCQSLTVTEHSIYASNPDLTSEGALHLQSGSSKQLLEHFFMQQHHQDHNLTSQQLRQTSLMGLNPNDIEQIFQQQKEKLRVNMDLALDSIPSGVNLLNSENVLLDRDQSQNQREPWKQRVETEEGEPKTAEIRLDTEESQGPLHNLRGFSFFGEGEDEREVKRQLIKYTKLRNKLNKRLKKIQDEEGVIKQSKLREISLSSPSSTLSMVTVLPTPPLQEDSSSRYSLPSNQFQRRETITSNTAGGYIGAISTQGAGNSQTGGNSHTNEQSFLTSGSPQALFTNIKHKIDMKQKQQMIFGKLGSSHEVERTLFKSFQPPSGTNQPATLQKKHELFRSNVEPDRSKELLQHSANQHVQLSHKDYLNDSIQQYSSGDEDDMGGDDLVAEERKSFTTVHQTQQTNQNLIREDMYRQKLLYDEETKGDDLPLLNLMKQHSLDEGYEYQQLEHMSRQSQVDRQELEESKDSSPIESNIRDSGAGTAHKNVKFILFNQNATKKKQDSFKPTSVTSITKQAKTTKLGRSKVSGIQGKNLGQHDYYPQSQSNQLSSLSSSGINNSGVNKSKVQQQSMIPTAITPAEVMTPSNPQQNNSSSSQAMTNSRDNQQNTSKEQRSMEKTTDYASTREHQSQKSGGGGFQQKNKAYEDDHHNRSEEKNVSDDLDKTANIINLQSTQKSAYKQGFKISPRKLQKNSLDLSKNTFGDRQINTVMGISSGLVATSPSSKAKKREKKLAIDTNSSPVISSHHSKHVSQNNLIGSFSLNDNLLQLNLIQNPSQQSDNDHALIGLPIQQIVNDEEEFMITKRFAQTVRAGGVDKMTINSFNFDSQNMFESGLAQQEAQSKAQTYGLKGAAAKLSISHLKKTSVDNLGNKSEMFTEDIGQTTFTNPREDFGSRNNTANDIVPKAKLSNMTPTGAQTMIPKRGIRKARPQNNQFGVGGTVDDDTNSMYSQDTVSEVTQKTQNSQNSRKGVAGVGDFTKTTALVKKNAIRGQMTLKKGTLATASTVNLPRPNVNDTVNTSIGQNQPSSKLIKAKPPLNMTRTGLESSTSAINPSKVKTTATYLGVGVGKITYSSNSGTPSAASGVSKLITPRVPIPLASNLSTSQPNSAKNSTASKFNFNLTKGTQ